MCDELLKFTEKSTTALRPKSLANLQIILPPTLAACNVLLSQVIIDKHLHHPVVLDFGRRQCQMILKDTAHI